MSILFNCKRCDKKLRARPQDSGRPTKCTGCNKIQRIPTTSQRPSRSETQEGLFVSTSNARVRTPIRQLPSSRHEPTVESDSNDEIPSRRSFLPAHVVLWSVAGLLVAFLILLVVVATLPTGGTNAATTLVKENDLDIALEKQKQQKLQEETEAQAKAEQAAKRAEETAQKLELARQENIARLEEEKRRNAEKELQVRLRSEARAKDLIDYCSRYVAYCATPNDGSGYVNAEYQDKVDTPTGFVLKYRFNYRGIFTGNPYQMYFAFNFHKDGAFANALKVESHNIPFISPFLGRDFYSMAQYLVAFGDRENKDRDMHEHITRQLSEAKDARLLAPRFVGDLSQMALVLLKFQSDKRAKLFPK